MAKSVTELQEENDELREGKKDLLLIIKDLTEAINSLAIKP